MRRLAEIAAFINEREAIRMRKAILEDAQQTGQPPLHLSRTGKTVWGQGSRTNQAWSLDCLTDDPILGKYRFCCVRREDDRVTRWIHSHIRVPFADHPYLWLMLCIARTINWPETLESLMSDQGAWPFEERDFSPPHMARVLQERMNAGLKTYTGAYMIRAESDPNHESFAWGKQRYIAEIVVGRLWEDRQDWEGTRPAPGQRGWSGNAFCDSRDVWEWLITHRGWGPFMAIQAVVDMQHTALLDWADDRQTWFSAGPGTQRDFYASWASRRVRCTPMRGYSLC